MLTKNITMKKIFLILFCLPLLFSTCKKEEEVVNNNNVNNQSSIVGKIWAGYVPEGFGDKIFELNNDGYLYFYNGDDCAGYIKYDTLGEWLIDGDTINFTATNNNFEYTYPFGIIDTYSSTELKLIVDANSNSICSIANLAASNSNCTNIPDTNFEYKLINLGYDNVLDGKTSTNNINTVTFLDVSGWSISDLTGIEAFTSLIEFNCSYNQLTSLNVNSNTALTYLDCSNNQINGLQLNFNTDLTSFNCRDNQLISLDIRNGNNTMIYTFNTYNNPSLNCISVDEPSWSDQNWQNIDVQHYFSANCK
jgi:hypothetical protein